MFWAKKITDKNFTFFSHSLTCSKSESQRKNQVKQKNKRGKITWLRLQYQNTIKVKSRIQLTRGNQTKMQSVMYNILGMQDRYFYIRNHTDAN